MFQGCIALDAIIMLNNPQTTSEVGIIANVETLGLANETVIYVPYLENEELYEEVVTNVAPERIEQVIKGVQPHPDHVGLYEEYIEEGYTVAGYSMDGEESNKWKQYGFYVDVDGIPVETDEVGSEWVRYILKR